MTQNDIELFQKLSLSMYRKDLLGITHGSISMKKNIDSFLINKKDAIFDEINKDALIDVLISKHMSWSISSSHTPVHSAIYESIDSAKFVACLSPPHIVAYSLSNKSITPKDFTGKAYFKNMPIYDPENLSDWPQRSPSEVTSYLREKDATSMVVKGVGIYACNRNIKKLVEEAAIINMSCHILLLEQSMNKEGRYIL